jgi:hypothetical protein
MSPTLRVQYEFHETLAQRDRAMRLAFVEMIRAVSPRDHRDRANEVRDDGDGHHVVQAELPDDGRQEEAGARNWWRQCGAPRPWSAAPIRLSLAPPFRPSAGSLLDSDYQTVRCTLKAECSSLHPTPATMDGLDLTLVLDCRARVVVAVDHGDRTAGRHSAANDVVEIVP